MWVQQNWPDYLLSLNENLTWNARNQESSESSSSESDEASSSDEKSWKSQTVQKKTPVNNVKSQYQRVSNSTQPTKVPNRKKDRFYDKSREIPNDVYFGDVTGIWNTKSHFFLITIYFF